MYTKKQLFPRDNVSAGYLLEISSVEQKKEIIDQIKKDFSDFWVLKSERLSIDEAHMINEALSVKSDSRAVVIDCVSLGREAQNALLKSLEEIPSGIKLFLIVSDSRQLIPTVISRLIKLDVINNERNNSFLDLSSEKKIRFVNEMVEGIKNEEKSKSEFVNWLDSLIQETQKRGDIKTLKTLWVCRKYALDQGASIKILAERVLIAVL